MQGDNCIQLLIEDGGPNDADFAINGSVEDPGAIMTEYQNQAPAITVETHDESYQEGQTVTFTAQGSDVDSEILTYLWEQVSGPAISFDDASKAQISFVAPEVSEDSVITLKVTVSDGQLSTVAETGFTVIHKVEVVVVTPEKERSSGGVIAWLFLLLIVNQCMKNHLKKA